MSSSPKVLHALAAVAMGLLACPRQAAADFPIFFQRYTADPGTLEWNGRLYLYASHDLDDQTSYQMFDITCISTDDLKNWTDHGECFNARTGSTWAQLSWAPTVVARNNKFYMYYGNGASGIGVAVASAPTGPFSDPRPRALVDASTPGVNPPAGMWIFDPSAFVDDDGRAYLYFGGNGISNIRVIQLGTDMVSTVGSAISLTAPHFFEAAWMHKNNGKYYFSYSTNWDSGAPTIDYMISSSPTSGFQFAGTILPQPPENNNNNHAGIFKYQNNWYIAYHNRTLARLNGVDPGFRRNLALDRLSYNSDGTIQRVAITTGGVPQLKNLNPYNQVEAETMNLEQGIETEPCSEGGRDVSFIENGDWTRVVGVNFGAGASRFDARVASAGSGGNIQLRLGSPTGTLIGTCAVPVTGGWQTWTTVSCNVSGAIGVQDLYLAFTGGSGFLFNVNWWKFSAVGGGGSSTISINAGGSAAGSFAADTSFSGGSTFSTTNAINTSQISGAVPPQSVFQTERFGEFTYAISGRTPGSAQTVTLYFAESFWTAAGQRRFNVAINGTTVLTAFDIFASAGGANRAIARAFTTTASATGQVVLQFSRAGGPDNPKISAITITSP